MLHSTLQELIRNDQKDFDIVFMKEMTFTVPESTYTEIANMPGVQHTFLIRDPALSLSSLHKIYSNEIGCDLSLREAGFKQTFNLYKFVKENCDKSPLVVDASDLQANPKEIMKKYCALTGIRFEPHMTSWEMGPVPAVSRGWAQWLSSIERSTGILQVDHTNQTSACLESLPEEIRDYVEECRPYYMEMYKERIRI